VYKELRKRHPDAVVELVIGSMRPADRDKQSERLRPLVGHERPLSTTQRSFIVSTQCLEVGADYDFDALVTECASLDALRQRFGRLNRAGRKVDASAVILVEKRSMKSEEKLKDDKPEDPIYGNALARTWNWLSRFATDETVDFGIDAFGGLLDSHGKDGRIPRELLAPSARLDAPVMLPAYVDLWCQTSPCTVPDPDVPLFLHGERRGEPDVQVCWRGDLIADGHMDPAKHWANVVSLLPPTSAECMTLPLSRARRWLAEQQPDDNDGDLFGIAPDEDSGTGGKKTGRRQQRQPRSPAVLWRGANDSMLITSPWDLRPGDTLVVPANDGGWNELGHVPCPKGEEEDREPSLIDLAELAFREARDRVALRIHPSLRCRFPLERAVDELFNRAASRDDRPNNAEWRKLLAVARDALPDDADFKATVSALIESGFTCEPYPDDQGVVLVTRKRTGAHTDWFLPPVDEGDDSASRTRRRQPVLLTDHTRHVVSALRHILARLPLAGLADAVHQAAELHDLGKADERFQAMLRRTDRTDAWLLAGRVSNLIAKSDGLPQTREQRLAACRRAGMPVGFRHEMLSVQLAQQAPELSENPLLRDLAFHLIAAHHGYARPFAPVVIDDDPPDVDVEGFSLTGADQLSRPLHRLDSGVAERFWTLTRCFGWWGLAYIESLLRLADQQASCGAEDSDVFARTPNDTTSEATA
jgi:CRISPR-associated endonuclease/helicase Cas3